MIRRLHVIVWVTIGTFGLQALGLFLSYRSGMSKEDIANQIPTVTAQTITTWGALILAAMALVRGGPRVRVSAERSNWNIDLSVHIQNSERERALRVVSVEVPGFYSEWANSREEPIVDCLSGRDIKCRLKPIGDPNASDDTALALVRSKRMRTTISYSYQGSGRVVSRRLSFHNPFTPGNSVGSRLRTMVSKRVKR
jgi:hypothetical protein